MRPVQEFVASVQPSVQQYLLGSGANGTVTVSADYTALPPFTVGCPTSSCAAALPSVLLPWLRVVARSADADMFHVVLCHADPPRFHQRECCRSPRVSWLCASDVRKATQSCLQLSDDAMFRCSCTGSTPVSVRRTDQACCLLAAAQAPTLPLQQAVRAMGCQLGRSSALWWALSLA